MTKVMNNSIFRSMMRIITIVLYDHQHKKTACCTELEERESVCGKTEALRSTADLLGILISI